MRIVRTAEAHAPAMAAVHAQAFDKSWREDEFEDLMEGAGIYGFLADGGSEPMGVILCRVAAGEMEILTVGVAPAQRRNGVAQALIAAALPVAHELGAESVFLEVAIDNPGAITLYERSGFVRAGLRKSYYDRGPAGVMDALVMRLDLAPRAPYPGSGEME